GSLYTDPEIYELELERIWYRTWVYVGHVSEVPQANDYVLKSIGPQQVIMTRDRDGEIHLLLNRCAHRANQVCDAPRGNSSAFRCPYHGWTFSNTGKLLGYPFNSGYGGTEAKKSLGLGRVARPRRGERHRRPVRGEVDGGQPRPRQRAHRERSAPGVPPRRPADGLVRDDAGPPARLRLADARGLRRKGRGDHDRRLAARHGLPEPLHRGDPAVRDPADGGRRDGPARHGRAVQGRARPQPADA